jgi:hypothetical protein
MSIDRRRARVCVLVKAYPQPSEQYEETVCVAGVDLETRAFLRLYPVPFRRLAREHQFDRYDVIEVELWRDTSDPRPESHKVNPDSIRVVSRSSDVSRESKIAMWAPAVTPTIEELERRMKDDRVTLGIVPINREGIRLTWKRSSEDADDDERALTAWTARQQALLEARALQPLPVTYSFYLRFQSGVKQREKRLMDWEAQATFARYSNSYGDGALDKMRQFYEQDLPMQHPHVFLGTMKARPFAQMILIGVLRSAVPPEANPGLGF